MPEDINFQKEDNPDRNPILIFLGFFLLGAALSLLLFGGDLLPQDSDSGEISDDSPLLDQVSELSSIGGGDTASPPRALKSEPLSIGDKAHAFTLSDLDGNLVSLSDFKGKPVIVNLWATWCAPCRIEMPVFQQAYERFQDDGLVILALDQDETLETVRNYFYNEMDLTFTPLLDEGSVVASAYGSYNVLPSTFFIDSQGLVTEIHRGPVTLNKIEGVLAAMNGSNG